jgi:hypothetical protein
MYVSLHSKFTAVVSKVITVTGSLHKTFILAPTATTVQKLWYYISNSQYFGTYKVEKQTDRQTDMTTTVYVPFLQITYKNSTNKLLDRYNDLNTYVA